MTLEPVIRSVSYCLAHVPDLVRHGSKPRRELEADPAIEGRLVASLRGFEQAAAYPPNRTFVGGLTPDELATVPRPWFELNGQAISPRGAFGEIVDQATFYALLAAADIQEPPLFALTEDGATAAANALSSHAWLNGAVSAATAAVDDATLDQEIAEDSTLAMYLGDRRIGGFRRDNRAEGREDPSLNAPYLLENLCTKASGSLALLSLLHRESLDAADVDFLISCGEEACGDRYQRGGGGMAKAIGEMVGCVNATGMDIKNFCAAPASSLMTAGALIKSGLFRSIVVVAGGSLAKLGMKFQSFLDHDIPILDDCLGAMAFHVTADDGRSPRLHLEPGTFGRSPIGSSASDESVYRHLVLEPLEALGLKMTDVDRYAPELHNPEIMEFAGSGDVARKNYRMLAALAVISGQIEKSDMNGFIDRIGMPGFAPTQGHIPSGVPYLGHAFEAMRRGEIRRTMILAKASLFLGRCTELFDGVSFVVEKNGD